MQLSMLRLNRSATPARRRGVRKSVLNHWKALFWLTIPATIPVTTVMAAESALFSQVLLWQESGRVVVAESDHEPRSVGSYSIRYYRGRNPDFPFDDFVTGAIFARDGVIESVHVLDVDGDDLDDLVVVQQTVGSGAYRNADAFSIGQSQIVRIGSVTGVAPGVDPLELLKRPSE